MVTSEAPRAFNREMYHDHPENVFYGTDDGAQDGSFSEFAEIKSHYENVAPERHEDIHMISVVGGLYGLNLIPLWKPKRITIFDINPTAVTYFKLTATLLTTGTDAPHFPSRLPTATTKPSPTASSLSVRTSVSSNAARCRASAAQPSGLTNRAGSTRLKTSR